MTYINTRIAMATLLFVATGCEISEDDRCLKGYEWDAAYQLCLQIETDVNEIDTAPQPNGVGTLCTTDTECTALALDVDFCVTNPMSQNAEGICSVSNCTPEDCPGPHACCDCTTINSTFVRTDVPFCVPNSRVGLIGENLACSCE